MGGSCVSDGMDRISSLSNDLLVKVLSFLPTKDAVSTTILSKRWECLWMWLPKLKIIYGDGMSLSCFLDRNLPLHRAPVIESLYLCTTSLSCEPQVIKLSIAIALSRYLRKLKIVYHNDSGMPNILPSSLYVSTSLVVLKLHGSIRLDIPRMVCLSSLKTLELDIGEFLNGESLRHLLSICPALEDLTVQCDSDRDDMGLLTVVVPSLQRLTFYIPGGSYGLFDKLVINTPSLKYLYLEDLNEGGHPFSIADMPNLEDAYVDVRYRDISSHIGSITSVKRLAICSETVYRDGFVFNHLEHLKLCVCTRINLLVRLLKDSPNLRVLDIYKMDHDDTAHWEDSPNTIDECVLATLEAFDWSKYLERRQQESDLAIYILGERWWPKDCDNLV